MRVAVRGDSGVAGEGRVVGIPKFHSWGKFMCFVCKCASLFFWFLWLVSYFSPPVIMSCCFVLFVSFFFVFYGLSPDCFLSLYVQRISHFKYEY